MSYAASVKLSLLSSAFVTLTLASSLALGGCSAPASEEPELGSTESAIGEEATIAFRGDYEEVVTGSLEKGKKVRVTYDTSRLTTCRGDQGGKPAWTITGYWRIGGGPIRTFEAGGHSASGGTSQPVLALDASGDLQVWFQNNSIWGCNAYDSNLGANYHFAVKGSSSEPGWIGNVRSVISRATCNNGGACDADLRPITGPVLYETWARQRAAIRAVTFEVWKEGVTDFDNADLWKQLDVQLHSRVGGTGAYATSYISFDRRLGNNARYGIDLRALDPIPGVYAITDVTKCPPMTRVPSAGPVMVRSTVDFYVTVNGAELRPEGGGTFQVVYENYGDNFAICP